MNKFIKSSLIVYTLLMSACVTESSKRVPPPSVKPAYNTQEQKKLTHCVRLSNTAMHAATQKLKGETLDNTKKQYNLKADQSTHWAIVDKVYKDSFNNAWQYSEDFFLACTIRISGIPQNRLKVANYCMQNQLIAGVAHLFRIQGKPIAAAKGYFSTVSNRVINDIIESVYKGKDNRSDTQMQIWQACITTVPE